MRKKTIAEVLDDLGTLAFTGFLIWYTGSLWWLLIIVVSGVIAYYKEEEDKKSAKENNSMNNL